MGGRILDAAFQMFKRCPHNTPGSIRSSRHLLSLAPGHQQQMRQHPYHPSGRHRARATRHRRYGRAENYCTAFDPSRSMRSMQPVVRRREEASSRCWRSRNIEDGWLAATVHAPFTGKEQSIQDGGGSPGMQPTFHAAALRRGIPEKVAALKKAWDEEAGFDLVVLPSTTTRRNCGDRTSLGRTDA